MSEFVCTATRSFGSTGEISNGFSLPAPSPNSLELAPQLHKQGSGVCNARGTACQGPGCAGGGGPCCDGQFIQARVAGDPRQSAYGCCCHRGEPCFARAHGLY